MSSAASTVVAEVHVHATASVKDSKCGSLRNLHRISLGQFRRLGTIFAIALLIFDAIAVHFDAENLWLPTRTARALRPHAWAHATISNTVSELLSPKVSEHLFSVLNGIVKCVDFVIALLNARI